MPNKRKSNTSQHSRFLSRKIQEAQKRYATFLNQKVRNWNRRQQKCFLFIICTVMGGISTHMLVNIVIPDKKPNNAFSLSTPSIKPPVMPRGINWSAPLRDTIIFHRFRKAIDSIQQTPEGRKAYMDFLQQHPGFLDSLANAEKLLKQTIHH